ncbi:AAA family ATPase [Acinetobacter brisouii]|uniref:AAA family ATPase n=1 Tax=Acinetobacter brisouii TaxID=396323 RepID=UPI00124F077E|nr:AAA family ATPase [Acinetobacter brisouii]
MTTQYLRQNDTYHIAPDVSGVAIDNLPAGFYRLCYNDKFDTYWLQIANPLKLIPKAYGNAYQHQARIMDTFNERTEIPTTVLLEGYKGTGKTLLAKKLCVDFVNNGGICILQNEPYIGESYKGFLQKIGQQKIVFIDEFDKVYTKTEHVNDMLTLLDGMYPMHTLFVMTMNADSRGSRYEYFHNRPGRVYYSLKFGSISETTIREYAADMLTNKGRVEEMIEYIGRFSMFNMDMLTVLVKEINKSEGTDLTVRQMGEFLNIKPTISYDEVRLDYSATYKGFDVTNLINYEYLKADHFERMMTDETYRFRITVEPNAYRKNEDGSLWKDRYEDSHRVIGFTGEDEKFVELPKYERVVSPREVECLFDQKTRVMSIHDKEHDLIIKAFAKPAFSYLNKDARVVNF